MKNLYFKTKSILLTKEYIDETTLKLKKKYEAAGFKEFIVELERLKYKDLNKHELSIEIKVIPPINNKKNIKNSYMIFFLKISNTEIKRVYLSEIIKLLTEREIEYQKFSFKINGINYVFRNRRNWSKIFY